MLSNPIRCAALAAALSLVGLASADGTLNGVSVEKSGPGVSVHIKGKDLARPTTSWSKNGNSLVLEFSGNLADSLSHIDVHKDGLNSISIKQADGNVRVVLALDAKKTPNLSQSVDGWDVSFDTITDTVAPLEPASQVMAQLHGPNADQQHGPAVTADSPRVTLNFTDTEIVQILKALAMQTGVNIVTAPDVKGTLSVTLDNVTVKDALDMVTSVSGLKYAAVGNSYIVATPDKINMATSALGGAKALMMETRIVPIYSGAGREIRASIFSSFNDADQLGQVHIYLPNEEFEITKNDTFGGVPGKSDTPALEVKAQDDKTAGGVASDANAGTDKEQVSVHGMKEQYLVLVGPSDTIGAVEDRIHDLDHEISKAYGFSTEDDTRLVRDTYLLRSDDVKASDLVKAVSATQPNNFLNVDMYATPGDFKNQSIVVVGREGEVAKAEGLLKDLDQSGYGDVVLMYDVKHADPRSLREALVAQVKGLRVSIPPASAGNTGVYTQGQAVQQAAQSTQAGGADSSTSQATAAAAGSSNGAPASAGSSIPYGLEQPYAGMEKDAVPMKLVLTGTDDEIAAAKTYLAQVDVAAKQVALELRVMELTQEDAEKIGIDWNVMTGSAAVRTITLDHSIANAPDSVGVHIGGRNWSADVTATLDAIANKDNLIARPNLLALDGRESEIFVGDVIRYVQSIQSTQNGTTVTTAEVPVGVRLAVMPRIGTDTMTLDLRPEVSFLQSFTPIPGGGELPQTSLRTAQSTISIHDGDTIAIGGLIQDQDNYDVTKVPILGDLPIIGRLFRSTSKDKQRREVVLFLTAKEVNDEPGNIADPRNMLQQHPAEIESPPKP